MICLYFTIFSMAINGGFQNVKPPIFPVGLILWGYRVIIERKKGGGTVVTVTIPRQRRGINVPPVDPS